MPQHGQASVECSTHENSEQRWKRLLLHRERLLRVAQRRLPNRAEAEDCVHDAMLRCVQFDRLDEGRMGEFLTTVVLRQCVDYYRRQARAHRLSFRAYESSSMRALDDVLCDRSLERWLLEAVHSLSGRQREIMIARAEGLSTAEAAKSLGVSLKAAEGAFTRGRARVLALWTEST
jgi:RNA polymerase sigma factor (sigma-70 family)